MRLKSALLIASCAATSTLTSCASIVSGNHQHITVNTSPAGAECNLYRHGSSIAHINSTPERVKVKRKGHDIMIGCVKQGYDFGQATNVSHFNGWLVGNLFFGGIPGGAIDLIDGASNRYSKEVNISLPALRPGIGQPSLPTYFPGDIPRRK